MRGGRGEWVTFIHPFGYAVGGGSAITQAAVGASWSGKAAGPLVVGGGDGGGWRKVVAGGGRQVVGDGRWMGVVVGGGWWQVVVGGL